MSTGLSASVICNRWKAGSKNLVAVSVVAVTRLYPDGKSRGKIITGIEKAERLGALVYHAGTAFNDSGGLVTDGGRILDVVGIGGGFGRAAMEAYKGIGKICFHDIDYRKDIAAGL